jgi:DNA repair protein RecO (recombination protein O)
MSRRKPNSACRLTMPIHETEAIVLRHYVLSEADRILVLFAPELGKMRAVARGARRPKSRLAGSLEPLNHVRVQFYSKEGSELAQIRQAELIHSYLGKNPSILHLYGFSYWSEIVQEYVEDNSSNPLLFKLFISVLNAAEKRVLSAALVRYFEFWTLRLSGLLPKYDACSRCGLYVKDDGFYVLLEIGQACCSSCSGGRGLHVHARAAKSLHKIFQLSPEEYSLLPMDGNIFGDLERLAQQLLQFHLEKQLKSYPLLRELVRDKA